MYGVGVRGVLNGMTKHLTGVPPVSSPARALDPRTEAYLALGDTTFLRFYRTVAVNCNL